jgi:hypothetical protein
MSSLSIDKLISIKVGYLEEYQGYGGISLYYAPKYGGGIYIDKLFKKGVRFIPQ